MQSFCPNSSSYFSKFKQKRKSKIRVNLPDSFCNARQHPQLPFVASAYNASLYLPVLFVIFFAIYSCNRRKMLVHEALLSLDPTD